MAASNGPRLQLPACSRPLSQTLSWLARWFGLRLAPLSLVVLLAGWLAGWPFDWLADSLHALKELADLGRLSEEVGLLLGERARVFEFVFEDKSCKYLASHHWTQLEWAG